MATLLASELKSGQRFRDASGSSAIYRSLLPSAITAFGLDTAYVHGVSDGGEAVSVRPDTRVQLWTAADAPHERLAEAEKALEEIRAALTPPGRNEQPVIDALNEALKQSPDAFRALMSIRMNRMERRYRTFSVLDIINLVMNAQGLSHLQTRHGASGELTSFARI